MLRTEKDMDLRGNKRRHPLLPMYIVFIGFVTGPKQLSI